MPTDLETLAKQSQGITERLGQRWSDVIQHHEFEGQLYFNFLEEIVLHVAHHNSYHRGQVALMLRQLGHPASHLIAFTH